MQGPAYGAASDWGGVQDYGICRLPREVANVATGDIRQLGLSGAGFYP